MSELEAFDYYTHTPKIFKALSDVHNVIDTYGLDRKIQHLVLLRASQINRCGFCVEMHTKEAREDGETSERLDRVIIWEQTSHFTEKEKAALAWTECLTALASSDEIAAARAQVNKQFSKQEIGALTAVIGMINLWNRINVSKH